MSVKKEKMMVTQEEVDKLPAISLDEFEARVEELLGRNESLKRLVVDARGWGNLKPHFLRDLFWLIGARPLFNKY